MKKQLLLVLLSTTFALSICAQTKDYVMEIENMDGDISIHEVDRIKEIRFREKDDSDNTNILDCFIKKYLDSKIKEVPNGKHFIFVTDTHWGGYNYEWTYETTSAMNSNYIINYVKTKLDIKNVVFGGDCFNEAPTKDMAVQLLSNYAEDFYSLFGEDGIWVQGNHDANAGGYKVNYSDDFEDYVITDEDVYKSTVKNIENRVVFDTEGIDNLSTLNLSSSELKEATEWFKLHYWYDDNENKIRYVVIETGDNGLALTKIFGLNDGNGPAYRAIYLQTDFLYKALKTCPAGYTIIMLGHMLDVTHTSYGIAMLYYMYRNKLAHDVAWNRTSMSQAPKIYEFLHNLHRGVASHYDFTDIESLNDIVIIGGHWHLDFNGLYQITGQSSNGAIIGDYVEWKKDIQRKKGQPIFVSRNRDAYGKLTSDTRPKWAYDLMTDEEWINHMPIMKQGTNNEYSFDVVTIKDDGIVEFTRFGAGESLSIPINE